MKTRKIRSTTVSEILVAMIKDHAVIARLTNVWDKDSPPFGNEYADLIGGWCVKHFAKYGKPINKNIQQKFEDYSNSKIRNDDVVEMMSKVLVHLSSTSKGDINSEYVLDNAEAHFEGVKARQLRDDLENLLDSNQVDDALKAIGNFKRIEVKSNETTYNVATAWDMVDESKPECLINYGEADLGHFFNDLMVRDSFVAFMGPEKRGKTFWLTDAAKRAADQGRNVAMFCVGDMGFNQMMFRIGRTVTGRPLKSDGPYINCSIPVAVSEEGVPEFQIEKRSSISFKKIKKLMVPYGDRWKMQPSPADTKTVSSIDQWLVNQKREYGWAADVVVIDYADILAAEFGTEGREAINKTWKLMRRMSQEHHCLVLTATQSDSASYDVNEMSMKNFSEDKRKVAHVTGMVGLGGDAVEVNAGIRKLNRVAGRESKYSQSDCCYAAGCYDVGLPAITGHFEAWRVRRNMDRLKQTHKAE